MTTTQPLVKTNLDTNFLKLIAIISMVFDHVGSVFFPEYRAFRWIGRLAFPIFCYCMTIGLMYTHDVKKYLLRLAIFALVSQPFYVLAKNQNNIMENLTNWNIFFTLFISLLAMWGFRARKWWLFVAGVLVIGLFNFDYSLMGIELMLIFYLCRQKPLLGAGLYVLLYTPAVFFGSGLDDPNALILGGQAFGFELFALLAMPLIFLNTKVKPRIPKWFFYGFYPAHLAVIALVRWGMGV